MPAPGLRRRLVLVALDRRPGGPRLTAPACCWPGIAGRSGPGSRPSDVAGGADVVQALVGGLLRQPVLLHRLGLLDLRAGRGEPLGRVGQRLLRGRVVPGIERVHLPAEPLDPPPGLGLRVLQRPRGGHAPLPHVVQTPATTTAAMITIHRSVSTVIPFRAVRPDHGSSDGRRPYRVNAGTGSTFRRPSAPPGRRTADAGATAAQRQRRRLRVPNTDRPERAAERRAQRPHERRHHRAVQHVAERRRRLRRRRRVAPGGPAPAAGVVGYQRGPSRPGPAWASRPAPTVGAGRTGRRRGRSAPSGSIRAVRRRPPPPAR